MKTAVNEIVSLEKIEGIGLISLHNPPVNAASHALRTGLLEAVEQADHDPDIRVIALYGEGRSFIAGADIREFGKPPMEPLLPGISTRIETAETPVISVLHGAALGGGLETALGTHGRVAIEGVKIGFPEVTLGIIPGAGGTQRAPRLCGIPAALDLITSGRRIDAPEALALGLVDRVTTGAPRDVALAAARKVLAGTFPTRRVRDIDVAPDPDAIARAKTEVVRRAPNLFSPLKCVEAIEASTRPVDEGMTFERALFRECIDSPQRAGLIHAFFAERAVAKIPEADAIPRKIDSIGVVGAGTMGSGIATAALLAGFSVVLADSDEDSLWRGRETIWRNLDGAVARGKLSQARRAGLGDNLKTTTALADFATVDLAIEAAYEDMAVKKAIFERLSEVCKTGALLATNTSYLDIDEIAAVTDRPEDVLGLHFFSPAHVMRLLEVVVAEKTAPDAVATGFALAKGLRKIAVRAGVCDGFIGNRILAHYRKAADYLVLDGASPAQVDQALESFGFAMGPFKVSDLAGGDIGWANRKRTAATRPATERYVEIADRICEQGWFGRKTGRGYYDYTEATPVPNPELAEIIAKERDRAGVTPRAFSDPEITERYMTAMISEASRVIEDGIALRPIDIDAVFLFGYGFPRFLGGPCHYADTIGADTLVARIETYAQEDPHYWQVPALLRSMAENGSIFADLNQ
ncbi:MAG: enoyl-CoA hydratase/isomerase family protein [Paracoccaceae bacterium]